MPVETFAAFATEQALGIVVGAVAVVAAPTVGPKLGEWGHNVVEGTKTATHNLREKGAAVAAVSTAGSATALTKIRDGAVGSASIARGVASDTANRTTALVAATPAMASTSLTKPLAESSRNAYGTVVDGARWYGEQWADLVSEARAGLSSGEGAAVRDVLADLSEAKVTSDLPGRARLRVSAIRGDKPLAEQVAESLAGISSVDQVRANANSGSLLVCYDTAQFASLDALLQSLAG